MGFLEEVFGKKNPDLNELIAESADANRFQVNDLPFEIKWVGMHLTGEVLAGKITIGMSARIRGKTAVIKRIDYNFKPVSFAEKGQKISLILSCKNLKKDDFSLQKTLDFD
ncbi:MAG: hypothetical protein ABIA76_03890 [Candidatus Diapherotrites archaeon]